MIHENSKQMQYGIPRSISKYLFNAVRAAVIYTNANNPDIATIRKKMIGK